MVMGLLKRLWQVLNFNISSQVTSTEDPETLLEETLLRMQQDLIALRQGIARAIASQTRNHRHYLQHQEQAHSWYHRAQLALMQNYEDLAQSALNRCHHQLQLAQILQQQIRQQEKLIDRLRQDLQQAQGQIATIKAQKDLYLARANVAQSRLKIQQLHEEMQPNWVKQEHQIEALEVENSLSLKQPLDDLEKQFRAMETENHEQLLNNINQNSDHSSAWMAKKVKIEEQLRHLRSQLENLE
jgi:phage shock protein A